MGAVGLARSADATTGQRLAERNPSSCSCVGRGVEAGHGDIRRGAVRGEFRPGDECVLRSHQSRCWDDAMTSRCHSRHPPERCRPTAASLPRHCSGWHKSHSCRNDCRPRRPAPGRRSSRTRHRVPPPAPANHSALRQRPSRPGLASGHARGTAAHRATKALPRSRPRPPRRPDRATGKELQNPADQRLRRTRIRSHPRSRCPRRSGHLPPHRTTDHGRLDQTVDRGPTRLHRRACRNRHRAGQGHCRHPPPVRS